MLIARLILLTLAAWYIIGNATWQAENYRRNNSAWCCYSGYEDCGGCP